MGAGNVAVQSGGGRELVPSGVADCRSKGGIEPDDAQASCMGNDAVLCSVELLSSWVSRCSAHSSSIAGERRSTTKVAR